MDIETPRPDGSLGPLYLAGALEAAGFETDILDASVGTSADRLEDTFFRPVRQENGLIRIGIGAARISEVVAQGGYTVVGINSNFTPQTRMAFEVAQAAKAVSRDTLVVAGGVNARALANRFLGSGVVDAVCLTEGERIFPALVRAWEKRRSLSDVSGIMFSPNGDIVTNKVRPGDTVQNLDELPFPLWHKLPFAHYDRIASPHGVIADRGKRSGWFQSSRGCWAECLYCHISFEKQLGAEAGNIGKLRFKSVERVKEEIIRLQGLGVTRLFCEDDTLFAKKARIVELFSWIKGRGLTLADVNGVNLVHFLTNVHGTLVIARDFMELLKAAGFDQIVFPVESASQRIIDTYATGKLNHSTLDVCELVRTAREVGITCPINMMIGFPDETEAEMRASIELGKRLVEAGAAYCTFFIPIPFPGCMLYEYALAHGHLNADFDTDIFNWKNAVLRNTTVPPERVIELRDSGWRYANTPDHVRTRTEKSAGASWEKQVAELRTAELTEKFGPRWQSGAPIPENR